MLSKMHKPYVLTDEMTAKLSVVSQGKVGDDKGVYFGTDFYTKLPITFDLNVDNDAMNILIAGATGSGKSAYVKTLIFMFLSVGYSVVIVDYEGEEYKALGKTFGVEPINIGGRGSKYFDTMQIGELTGIKEIDDDLMQDSKTTTQKVFHILTDEKNGMTTDEVSVFSDILYEVYLNAGVYDDKPETWHKSINLSYNDIFNQLLKMMEDKSYYDHYKNEIDHLYNAWRVYFTESGLYYGLFKNRMTINELLQNKFNIISFSQKGRASDSFDSKEIALKQLYVGYITNLVANHNKKVYGNLTAVIFEEGQRYLKHESSSFIVSNAFTGGRKRNMIGILVTNSPNELVMTADSGSEVDKNVMAIKSNITDFVIGALKSEILIENLCKEFDLEKSAPDLIKITKNIKVPGYEHRFLVSVKGETTIAKMDIPRWLAETDVFKTRNVIK